MCIAYLIIAKDCDTCIQVFKILLVSGGIDTTIMLILNAFPFFVYNKIYLTYHMQSKILLLLLLIKIRFIPLLRPSLLWLCGMTNNIVIVIIKHLYMYIHHDVSLNDLLPSRNTGNIGHKTQNEDKQHKPHNTETQS